ncbi:MAG: hypothetical protein HC906_03805 [Bacteroidales bacterium]|nr:hypothetical protein [Bacteroidales bacterium]
MRRLFRNSYERYHADPYRSFKSFFRINRAHEDLVIKQKSHASTILEVPFSLEMSIHRFGLQPLYQIDDQFISQIIFSYYMNSNEGFHVVYRNRLLYFVLVCQKQVFLEFQIQNNEFNQLKKLDFESV